MQTKQKPHAPHIYTERLIEICTDTKRQKHMQTQNVKIIKHNKSYIKQIQDKYLDLIAYSQLITSTKLIQIEKISMNE